MIDINKLFIKFNPHNVMAYDTNRKQLIFPTSYIATKIYKENQELFKSSNTYSISLNMYLFYLSQDKRDNTNDIIYANDKMKDIITNSKGYLYIENKIFYEYNKPIKHDDILILTDKDDTNFKVLDNIGDEEIKIYNIYNNIKDVKKAYAKIHNVKNIYIAQMCKRYRDNQ